MSSFMLYAVWTCFYGNEFAMGQEFSTRSKLFFSLGPTAFPKSKIDKCEYVPLRGFLKMRCFAEGKWHYKCPFSNTYYRELHVGCLNYKFTHTCPDDPSFYQACGHSTCTTVLKDFSPGLGVCGEIICQIKRIEPIIFKYETRFYVGKNLVGGALATLRCDGKASCHNVIDNVPVDEAGCKEKSIYFSCLEGKVTEESVWSNLVVHLIGPQMVSHDKVCDLICDCRNCADEALCHNNTLGLWCGIDIFRKDNYFGPINICDGSRDCLNGDDEKDCTEDDLCESSSLHARVPPGTKRSLNMRNKCGPLHSQNIKKKFRPVCNDFKDQMNCSASKISPLTCNVNGYPTTLSEYVICKGYNLCDDGIDNDCVYASLNCYIHKHRLCDGVPHCSGAIDEGVQYCSSVTSKNITCIRRLSYEKSEMQFPTSWIMDGINDCVNGFDEKNNFWFKRCGTGQNDVYSIATMSCQEIALFRCPKQEKGIDINKVCTDFRNCDASVCLASRRPYMIGISIKAFDSNKVILFHCLPGLESLLNTLGPCGEVFFEPPFKIFGVARRKPILTSKQYAKNVNCDDVFGEMYVTLACTNQCQNNVFCPLTRLNYSSCTNYPDSRTFTITEDYKLTVVLGDTVGTYRNDVFGCANGRCVEYRHVCDLTDDCGDASDESRCSNSFQCTDSGEYIPRSMKCNGKFECFDYSDECNSECDSQKHIFQNKAIYMASYILGLTASFLNIFIIFKGFAEMGKLKTGTAIINKVFVLMISFGDLLQGIFLFSVAITDEFVNKSTCMTQFEWTTGSVCSAMGSISTIGSLISLYSMTSLSILRAQGARRMRAPTNSLSLKNKISLFAVLCGIIICASTVAIIPILFYLEDFFVTNLNYEDRVFSGNPDKAAHMNILQKYFGRFSRAILLWKQIKVLVLEMFINIEVRGKPIDFYGANGICLFNYFISPENPQIWYSAFVLTGNLCCVVVITGCYMFVYALTRNSSAMIGTHNKHALKTNKKIQRKISTLIMTDLVSWVPFMIACLIHYSGVMETSRWYSAFSIIILPSNSIINPILMFDKDLMMIVKKLWSFTSQNKYVTMCMLFSSQQGGRRGSV